MLIAMNLRPMRLRSALLVIAGALATFGCRDASLRWRGNGASNAESDTLGMPIELVRSVPSRARATLVEGSAAVMSEAQRGVLFTVNDSGNEPYLFALDSLGADRGAWLVTGATNVDWESMAWSRCEPARPAPANAPAPTDATIQDRCLLIGDTGDNDAKRQKRTMYRVREPVARDSAVTGELSSEHFDYRYSDGPHDVEAMYAAPNGTIYLITKRRLRTGAKRLRPALVFSIDNPRWNATDTVVAQLVDSLPIVPGSAPFRTITDASLSTNGRRLAMRTYAQLYVFSTDSATGRVRHEVPTVICNVDSLGEETGEGVSWVPGSDVLVLTSEGRASPLNFVRCGGRGR